MANTKNISLPPGALKLIQSKSQTLKDSPKHFIGREDELTRFKDLVQDTVAPQPGLTAPTGATIMAAPGAGKTSLIRELAKRLRAKGTAVASITPSDMGSPGALADALKRQPPWSTKEWRKQFGISAAVVTSDGVDRSVQFALNTGALLVGLPPLVPNFGVAKGIAQAWATAPEPGIDQTLLMLDLSSAEGSVLLVDEGQRIHDVGARSEAAKNCIDRIILSLATPDQRHDAGITRSTIIMAGLSDTQRMVRGTGSYGLMPHVLAPLPTEQVRELVTWFIRQGSDGDAELATMAEAAWRDQLCERYGDWTRHAQAGATAAMLILRAGKREAVQHPNGMMAVVALADRYRNEVYDAVKNTAEDDGVAAELAELIGHALRYNGNLIPERQFRMLIGKAVEARYHTDPSLPDAVNITINRLLRAGIIDRTNHIQRIAPPNCVYGPIPSLNRYLIATSGGLSSEAAELLTASGLKADGPDDDSEHFRPDWAKLSDTQTMLREKMEELIAEGVIPAESDSDSDPED